MTNTVNFSGRPVWAEINLGAAQRNLLAIRKFVNSDGKASRLPRQVMSIVKANAYGHGAVPISKALAAAGADWFGVACVSEGVELRNAGIEQPILVLGGYWAGEEQALLEHRLSPAVTHCHQLAPLERAATATGLKTGFGIHLKVNTGMNRLGIAPKDVDCFAGAMAKCPHLKLIGTFTHFASSERMESDETQVQQTRFIGALGRMSELGLSPGLVHMANSGAIGTRPSAWGDLVRPGAASYGYHPSYSPASQQASVESKLPLEPILSLRTRIVAVRDLEAGEGVGYNAKFVTCKPSRIAVIAAGYADGLMRALSGRGSVLVRGRPVPIVGNISMDMATIDVSEVSGAAVGEIVTIYGEDNGTIRTAADLSLDSGTVVQDVLCAIGQRVRRIYVN